MEHKIFVISGPGGVGKNTLISYILETFSEKIVPIINATTRSAKAGEQHGKDYYFLTLEEFQHEIDRGNILEYNELMPGKLYGTLKSEFDTKLPQYHCLLQAEVNGVQKLRTMFPQQLVSIFIQPPSIDELRVRLMKRSRDGIDEIEKRIQLAEYELSLAHTYTHTVINDELARAQQEIASIISSYL